MMVILITMIKIFNKMIKGNFFQLVMLVCSLVLVSAGCTEEDDYKKFLEGGEIYYPGRIE